MERMTPPRPTARSYPRRRAGFRSVGLAVVLLAAVVSAGGCGSGPRVLGPDERQPIDRKLVESPSGFDLEVYADGLTGPVSMAIDGDGNTIVAESGADGSEPRIYGFTPDRVKFDVYPFDKPLLPFAKRKLRLYGPVGGIQFHKGSLYVSHRDENDLGVITALDYKGGHRTVIAGMPAQGEHGLTGLAISPVTGRLFFGIGSASNSGVVGPDDFAMGWVKDHPEVHDVPYTPTQDLVLWGRRMNSANPLALWLMPDIVVTAPFQRFGSSLDTRIKGATANNPRCNSAILSCQLDGGDLKVESFGIRLPRGLGFRPNSAEALYFTNQGMEPRGTRPVNNDPDSFLRQYPGYYGFPDYTTHLQPVTDPQFQPPEWLIVPSGYRDLAATINEKMSGTGLPPAQETAVFGVFPSQSGAAGFDFLPNAGPFREYGGSAIVAMFGDRSPWATSGQKLQARVGSKLVRVDPDRRQVRDFVKNVTPGPGSANGSSGPQLERPVDVKMGPDGALYILDFGQMRVKNGKYDVKSGTGRIFRLIPSKAAAAAETPAP